VLEFIAKKRKLKQPSTHERGVWHQNHLVMNAHILSDAQSILQQNKYKVTIRAWAKVALEWDCLEKATQGHEEVLKPPIVKFA